MTVDARELLQLPAVPRVADAGRVGLRKVEVEVSSGSVEVRWNLRRMMFDSARKVKVSTSSRQSTLK